MWLAVLFLTVLLAVAAMAEPGQLGFRTGTTILAPAGGEACAGTELLARDDGSFENGYLWSAIEEPDWSSWAEGYNADFVCAVQLLLTQTGFYTDQTMDVYVWASNTGGDPPPGPDPGNVICVLRGVDPGPIAEWPEISIHEYQVCCPTGGEHFVGFWPDWNGTGTDVWFIVADENGPGAGFPRTKILPDLGFPSGWQHPNVVFAFEHCQDLGIRELAGPGDCQPTPTRETTWGRIKALY